MNSALEVGSNRKAENSTDLLAKSAAALVIEIVSQLFVGVILVTKYSASTLQAHQEVAAMHKGGAFAFLQGFHYWGSAFLILHAVVHTLAMVWFGGYRSPNGMRFIGGICTMLSSIGFQMTGNVLPFDRHGVQTAGIEAGIAARAPIFGTSVSHLLLGGNGFGEPTLHLWFLLHAIVLPFLAVAGIALIAWPNGELSLAKRAGLAAWAPIFVLSIIALIVASPLGSPATAADYNAFDAKVSWYVWPLHGTMRMFEAIKSGSGWVGAMVLPGLLVAVLVCLPFLSKKIGLGVARATVGTLFGIILVGGLLFGGSFADLTGTRDPVEAKVAPTVAATSIDKMLAEKGRTAFNRLPCSGCHGTDGKVGSGGPSLVNEWKKHSDVDFYVRYIKNPTSVQPNSTMPPFPDTSAADLAAVAEYLRMPK